MSPNHWMSLAMGAILLIGCAKKPQPQVEAPEPTPPPIYQAEPTPDTGPSERDRIQQRINEVFLPIYFGFDESTLSGPSRSRLSAIGDLLKEYSVITVRIEGHTDERGTNEYNLALGERRANSAREYLVSYGIAASRLTTLSYGEERPAESCSSESCWDKNRRAEFTTSF